MKAIFIIYELLSLHMVIAHTTNGVRKRAADDSKLYVLAGLDDACVSVDSVEPCPLTWKLSSYASKLYLQQTKLVNITLQTLKLVSAGDDCLDAMKKTICAQATPKCLADGSQDYGDVSSVCRKIYSTCPANIAEAYKTQKLCDKVSTGKISKPACVDPPKIEGNCPQPKYKMPSDALTAYEKTSAGNGAAESLRQAKASPECISQIQRLECMPVYCSEDEKYMLTEFTMDDCKAIANKCFTQSLGTIREKFRGTCDIYPGGPNVTTAAIPPTVRSTGSSRFQRCDSVVLVMFSVFIGKLSI